MAPPTRASLGTTSTMGAENIPGPTAPSTRGTLWRTGEWDRAVKIPKNNFGPVKKYLNWSSRASKNSKKQLWVSKKRPQLAVEGQ